MASKNRESRWLRLQRGQAMMEYWPTIPAGIAIMIAAGLIAQMVNSAFLRTTDALNRAGLGTEICNSTTETKDGDDVVLLDDHTIQASSAVYDPETNTTTVTYSVTSGTQPSISHWVLALPKSVADAIIETSEKYEWVDNDPTTGVTGIKFDTPYDGGGTGGPPPKDKPPKKGRLTPSYTRYLSVAQQLSTGDGREIAIVLSGQYEFEPTEVVIKAGDADPVYGTISAPSAPATTPEPSSPTDLLHMDTLNEGCAS